MQQRQPERLRRLEMRMMRFEEELNQAGVDPEELSPPGSTLRVFAAIVRRLILFLLMLGPALIGTITHYPAYKLGGYLATRFSRDSDDVISTIKIISAMLLVSTYVDRSGGRWLCVFRLVASRVVALVSDSVLRLCRDCLLRRAGQIDSRSARVDVFPGEEEILCEAPGRAKRNTKRDHCARQRNSDCH